MLKRASSLIDHVRARLIDLRHPTHRPLIIALSGGIDSQVLAVALQSIDSGERPSLHAVHVDHGLRKESSQDAERVRALCETWSLPCDVVKVDVDEWDTFLNQGTEAAARAARYAALARVAIDMEADTLTTAHHLNDQVETVLLRLISGAGLEGLRGMDPDSRLPIPVEPGRPAKRRLRLFRPLLEVSRDEIEAFAREHGLEPIEDDSNASLAHRRNAVRHTLIPAIAKIEPGFLESVGRTAELLRDDASYIRDRVEDIKGDVVAERDGVWMIELKQFRELHVAIQRRVLLQTAERLLSDRARLTRERIEALRASAVEGDPGKTIELAESIVGYVDYDRLALGNGETLQQDLRRLSWIPLLDPDTEIQIGGEVDVLLDNGWRVRGRAPEDAHLTLRTRREGDRTRGARGRRIKLQDWMVDRKLPRYVRDWVPVVASGDEVQWVIGLDMTDYSDSRADVHLQLELDVASSDRS